MIFVGVLPLFERTVKGRQERLKLGSPEALYYVKALSTRPGLRSESFFIAVCCGLSKFRLLNKIFVCSFLKIGNIYR